jgi:hypothetical protein
LPGSHTVVWWMCEKGHEWQASINNRSRGTNCPQCYKDNRKKGPSNAYLEKHGSLSDRHPLLVEEWHPTKNGDLRPDKVTSGTNRKAWWICKNGHQFQSSIASRANGAGCPECAQDTQGKLLSISIAKQKGSFAADNSELLSEWHRTKNIGISPNHYSAGSSKVIWWQCARGHEWQAAIKTRVKGHGCPLCSGQTSRWELRLFAELSFLFNDAEWRKKIEGIECDVFLPILNTAVELDGYPWHHGRELQDEVKQQRLTKYGIRLIRLRDCRLKSISSNDVEFKAEQPLLNPIKQVVRQLMDGNDLAEIEQKICAAYLNGSRFSNEKTYKKMLSYFPGPPPEKSIAFTHPELVAEWSDRNAPLTPEMFSQGSSKTVWWLGPCGHEWQARISKRTGRRGCPKCARADRGAKIRAAAIRKSGSLKDRYPELAATWHPIMNGSLKPDDVPAGSTQKVWWKGECSHEWEASIYDRVKSVGCPQCFNQRRGRLIQNAAVKRNGSIEDTHPELCDEWHPKHNSYSPCQISFGSSKKVWWLCTQGHEWEATVKSRSKGRGCPVCAKQKHQ